MSGCKMLEYGSLRIELILDLFHFQTFVISSQRVLNLLNWN